MRDKKHIDRLFQEGLKNFEVAPNPAVWENIEAKPNKDNDKRKILPIWWLYAGVAALLLVFLALGVSHTFYNSEDIDVFEVVDTDTTRSSVVEEGSSAQDFTSGAVQTEVSSAEIQKKSGAENSELVKITSEEKNSQSKLNSQSGKNMTIASSSGLKDSKHISEKTKTPMVTASDSVESTEITSDNTEKHLNLAQIEDVVADTRKEEGEVKSDVAVVDNKTGGLTIEEALDKANSILIEKKTMNARWSIAATAAPVYFNTSGEGSAIDPQFTNNSKSGEVYISYGISASYALTDRLSIRSGISNLSLGYNTDNVVVYESAGISVASTNDLQNVNTSKMSGVRVASEVTVSSGDRLEANSATASFINESQTSINQNLSYVEVPVELQYALINKKFGLHVVGGFSSLFLNGNEIFTDTESAASYFSGEANNINKISYSANFGVGLNYQVSKKVGLNLEPMLKYQINTFKNTFGDFRPFFVGVYTGVAIKF